MRYIHAHKRIGKGGKVVVVHAHYRRYSRRPISFCDIVKDLSGQFYYNSLERAELYYPNDVEVATLIAALSHTEVYEATQNKRSDFAVRRAIKRVDNFIASHQDSSPIIVYSGVNLSLSETKETSKGTPFNMWRGLPLYTSRNIEEAQKFMGSTSNGSYACLLKIEATKGGGVNTRNLSTYKDEEEHLFKSTTRLRLKGKPIKMIQPNGSPYWEVPCEVVYE